MSTDDIPPPNLEAGQAIIDSLMSGESLASMLGQTAAESEETVYYLAHTFYGQGKYKEATQMFSYLLTTNHVEQRYYLGFAACMQKLRRYVQALKYYGMASVIDLTDPNPVLRCAECYLAMGNIPKARLSLDYALMQARAHEIHSRYVPRLEAMLSLIDSKPGAAQAARSDAVSASSN